MKTRKMTRKLVLNKKTVADLNSRAMNQLYGGIKTGITCGLLCDTENYSCYETQCETCYHTCPPTWCDTECGC